MPDYLVFISRGDHIIIESVIDRLGYIPIVLPIKDHYDLQEFRKGYDYAQYITVNDRVVFVEEELLTYIGWITSVKVNVTTKEFLSFLRRNKLDVYIGFWKQHLDRANSHVVALVGRVCRIRPILVGTFSRPEYLNIWYIRELLKEYAITKGLIRRKEVTIGEVEEVLKMHVPEYKRLFAKHGGKIPKPYMRLLPNTMIIDELIGMTGLEPVKVCTKYKGNDTIQTCTP